MPSPRVHGRVLSLLVIALFAVASGTVHAEESDVDPASGTQPAEERPPVVITGVQPAQSCGGEWTVSGLASNPDGSVIALIGTDEDYEIGLQPDGVTVSRLSNCTLNIATSVADGLSYAVTKVSFEGRAFLDAGMSAEYGVSYGFQGGAMSPRVTQHVDGPYEGDVSLDEAFAEGELVWSRCDAPQPLQVRTSLYLENGDLPGTGTLSMSLAPGVLMLVVELATRPCTAGGA
jgi:hypothetical protein